MAKMWVVGPGEMAQWVKGLLCKHEVVSSDPSDPHKNLLLLYIPVIPVLVNKTGRCVYGGGCPGLLDSQPH